jgi:hypothetical protein
MRFALDAYQFRRLWHTSGIGRGNESLHCTVLASTSTSLPYSQLLRRKENLFGTSMRKMLHVTEAS